MSNNRVRQYGKIVKCCHKKMKQTKSDKERKTLNYIRIKAVMAAFYYCKKGQEG